MTAEVFEGDRGDDEEKANRCSGDFLLSVWRRKGVIRSKPRKDARKAPDGKEKEGEIWLRDEFNATQRKGEWNEGKSFDDFLFPGVCTPSETGTWSEREKYESKEEKTLFCVFNLNTSEGEKDLLSVPLLSCRYLRPEECHQVSWSWRSSSKPTAVGGNFLLVPLRSPGGVRTPEKGGDAGERRRTRREGWWKLFEKRWIFLNALCNSLVVAVDRILIHQEETSGLSSSSSSFPSSPPPPSYLSISSHSPPLGVFPLVSSRCIQLLILRLDDDGKAEEKLKVAWGEKRRKERDKRRIWRRTGREWNMI